MPIDTCKGTLHRHELDVKEVVHERPNATLNGKPIIGQSHHTEWYTKAGELVRRDINVGSSRPAEHLEEHIARAKSRTKVLGDVVQPTPKGA